MTAETQVNQVKDNKAIVSLFNYIHILEEDNKNLRILLEISRNDTKAIYRQEVILSSACEKIFYKLMENRYEFSEKELIEFAGQTAKKALNVLLEEGNISNKNRKNLQNVLLRQGPPPREAYISDICKLFDKQEGFLSNKIR